jgi:hypothetical protein
MADGAEVFGCVPSGRGVAAPHVTTGQAEPEMNPSATRLEAFLAAARIWFDISNLIQMGALVPRVILSHI